MINFAVCISGHLRTFNLLKNNYFSFLEFLKKKGNVDVFLTTWNYLNADTGYHLEHLNKNLKVNNLHLEKTPSTSFLKKHFKAKKIQIFDQDFFASSYSPLRWNLLCKEDLSGSASAQQNCVFHFCKMLFLINQCNLLKSQEEFDNQKKYNVVFRIRPDYFFDEFLINTLNILKISPFTLYSSAIHSELDDQFIYGDSYSMDFFSNSLMRLSDLFNNKITFNHEDVILESIKKYSFIKIHNIPVMGHIERGS